MCVCAAGVGGDVRRVHVAVAVAGTWRVVAGGAGGGWLPLGGAGPC